MEQPNTTLAILFTVMTATIMCWKQSPILVALILLISAISRLASDSTLVNLMPGEWSFIGDYQNTSPPDLQGQTALELRNIFIPDNVLIENFIGSNFADVIVGNDADNVLAGGDGNDVFFGGASNDTISGGTGDDQIRGGAGNDYLDGGDGTDTATYFGALENYTVTSNADGSVSISGDGTHNQGTDTLLNVENVRFIGGSSEDVSDDIIVPIEELRSTPTMNLL